MVPFDTESPFVTSGIRVGTSALTSRGVKETEISRIVDMIDRVLSDISNESTIASVRAEVNEMMSNRPLFQW
jgi:glycine hydroxymethyltransferase